MGLVFDIQRFCTHDGPGIRTTVFFKGCPLDCKWCHNPESKSLHPELFYNPTFCIACGRCADVCAARAHSIDDGCHVFDRSRCQLCMACTDACPALALETTGKGMTVEQVLAEVEKDRVFYEESDGGMTLSGGEPMLQFEFTRDLLAAARSAGLHTCVETSGFGATDEYLEIAPLVDLFLWDIKDTDPDRHRANTGAALDPILHNLSAIDQAGAISILRCIVLNGINLNEQHLDRLIEIRDGLKHCTKIELLPYHSLGDSKHERLGRLRQSHPEWVPSEEQVAQARAHLDVQH